MHESDMHRRHCPQTMIRKIILQDIPSMQLAAIHTFFQTWHKKARGRLVWQPRLFNIRQNDIIRRPCSLCGLCLLFEKTVRIQPAGSTVSRLISNMPARRKLTDKNLIYVPHMAVKPLQNMTIINNINFRLYILSLCTKYLNYNILFWYKNMMHKKMIIFCCA